MSMIEFEDLPQPEREATVPPDELSVDGDNPNEQSDDTFGLLCDRMRERGWIGGSIVADTDGLIADGEHRWRAAQEIGLAEVPVKFFELSDADRRMVRQELNKISGEHDKKRDALEYSELLDAGKSDEVDALVNAADEDLDELLAEIRVDNSAGVLYEYDIEHNVWFEDCVEGMAERLDDNSVGCVITDPPYGMSHHEGGGLGSVDYDFQEIENDGVDDALELFTDVAQELRRVLSDDGHLFVFATWRTENDFADILNKAGFEIRSRPVWVKSNANALTQMGNADNARFSTKHESLIFAVPTDGPTRDFSRTVADVFEYSKPKANTTNPHPTQKPNGLIVELLELSTSSGHTVLDPFMGSGTTAVAAIQNDRNYVGFEIDEENYRSVTERRISEAKRQMQSPENQPETEPTTGDDD